jgi:hypothetical protein
MFAALLLLFAGSSLHAQLWPEHTVPGIDFMNGQNFSLNSLQWIRSHHLRLLRVIKTDEMSTSSTDTIQWSILYSGDTLVAVWSHANESSFIDKFDRNNTLRSHEFVGTGYTFIERHDSCGLIVYRKDNNKKSSVQRWSYTDNKHYFREDNPWYSVLKYYGLKGRIDSEVIVQKGRKNRILDYNIFDVNNLLVCSVSPQTGYALIDSSFYYSDGILARSATYQLNFKHKKHSASMCLCSEDFYDSHENEIKTVRCDRQKGCGSDFVTRETKYEYDSMGRPVRRVNPDLRGYTTYQWEEDNRPIAAKEFDGNGDLRLEERYEYEF